MNGLKDLDLARRVAKSHDPEAFAEIIRRYQGLVYGVCLRVLGNPQDAEDASQECFLKLARKAAEVRFSLGGWLHRQATCLAIDGLRRRLARTRREKVYSEMKQNGSDLSWPELSPHLDQALNELPDELRHVLVEHFLQGRTIPALAEELGLSTATVNRRLRCGLDELQAKLRKAGIALSAALLLTLLSEHGAVAAPATLSESLGKLTLMVGTTPRGRSLASSYGIWCAAVLMLLAIVATSLTLRSAVLRAKAAPPVADLSSAAEQPTAERPSSSDSDLADILARMLPGGGPAEPGPLSVAPVRRVPPRISGPARKSPYDGQRVPAGILIDAPGTFYSPSGRCLMQIQQDGQVIMYDPRDATILEPTPLGQDGWFPVDSNWFICWDDQDTLWAYSERHGILSWRFEQGAAGKLKPRVEFGLRGMPEPFMERLPLDERREAELAAELGEERDPALVAAETAAREGWREYPNNPVFRSFGPSAWPWVVYDRNQFGEGPDGPYYKMWYDMVDDGITPWSGPLCMGLAVSMDGIHWGDLGQVERVSADLRRGAGHPCVLYSPHGFGRARLPYRMYYWDMAGISMEESEDGFAWNAYATQQVLPPGSCIYSKPYLGGMIYSIAVTYNDGGTPSIPDDDTFLAGVNAHAQPTTAWSTDGVTWSGTRTHTLFSAWPIVNPSEFRHFRFGDGPYLLFYHLSGAFQYWSEVPGGGAIAVIAADTLTEGSVNFLPEKSIFQITDGVAWRDVCVMQPAVVYDEDCFSGHGDRVPMKMWFCGGNSYGQSGIGYAVFVGKVAGGQPEPTLTDEQWEILHADPEEEQGNTLKQK